MQREGSIYSNKRCAFPFVLEDIVVHPLHVLDDDNHGKGDHRQAAVVRSDVVRPRPLTPPIGPAYLAASLRHAGHTARIVDGLGENPFQVTPLFDDKVMAIGLRSEEIVERIDADTDLIGASSCSRRTGPRFAA